MARSEYSLISSKDRKSFSSFTIIRPLPLPRGASASFRFLQPIRSYSVLKACKLDGGIGAGGMGRGAINQARPIPTVPGGFAKRPAEDVQGGGPEKQVKIE